MTPEVVQAKPVRACTSQTAFSLAPGEFVGANSGAVQAVQANSYCTHVSLFSEWKGKRRGYNRETPVPPVPVNENRNGDTVSGDSRYKRTPAEPVPPPSPDTLVPPTGTRRAIVPSDYAVIPWPIDIDPLHTGRLTGKVPGDWSRDGWIMSLKDRIKRTRIQPGRRMLQAELGTIEDQELGEPRFNGGH